MLSRCTLLALLLSCCLPVQSQDMEKKPAPPELKLGLSEAVGLAVRNNLELRQAMIDERIRQEQVRETLGTFDPVAYSNLTGGRREVLIAGDFPGVVPGTTVTRVISSRQDEMAATFGVSGILETGLGYNLFNTTDYVFRQEGSSLNPIYNNSTTLVLTQPILRAAWEAYHEAPVELARIGALASHQAWRGQVRDKVMEVQRAYYDFVFARADRDVKIKSRETAITQVDDTALLVRTGGIPAVENDTAESGLAGREADLVAAEGVVLAREDRLRRLILSFETEQDWETRLVPTEDLEAAFVGLKERDVILLMAERQEPSVLEAHLAVATAEVELGQRENEAQPKLDLEGRVGVVGLKDDLFQSHADSYGPDGALSWRFGLAFEYPLGNRTRDSRKIQAELNLRKQKIALQDVRTEVAFQVRNAWRDVTVAWKTIRARKKAREGAEKQFATAKLKLKEGTSTRFEVFEVEEELRQRERDEIQAIIEYRLAILELSRSSGVPMEDLLDPTKTEPLPEPPKEKKDDGR